MGVIRSSTLHGATVSFADLLRAASRENAAGTTGLTQILTQKYLAFFQHSGLEAFYNQRRTGVPTFLVGPGTGNSRPAFHALAVSIDRASVQHH